MSQNVFADEWRECLRAHYQHVIRVQDKVTEPSLTVVMHEAGFSDADLRALRLQATLRAEDVGEDFVPDMAILTPPQPLPASGEGLSDGSSPPPRTRGGGRGVRSDEVPQSEAQVFAVPEMPESVAEEVQVEDELAVDESEVIEDDEVEPPQQLSLF